MGATYCLLGAEACGIEGAATGNILCAAQITDSVLAVSLVTTMAVMGNRIEEHDKEDAEEKGIVVDNEDP